MVYSIHTGGRKGSRIQLNHRAIVLHQGGQCRWAGGMKGWLIRAQSALSKRISCEGQSRVNPASSSKLPQVPEQSEFTQADKCVAAGHLQPVGLNLTPYQWDRTPRGGLGLTPQGDKVVAAGHLQPVGLNPTPYQWDRTPRGGLG